MRAHHLLFCALAATSACSLPYPADVVGDSGVGPGTISIDVANDQFFLRTGGGVSIGVVLTRGAGADGDVSVTIASPPVGVTVDPLTIPSGTNNGMLVAHATANAMFGRNTLVVDAALGTSSAHDNLDLDVIGAPGDLDTSFGSSGMVTMQSLVNSPAITASILAQSDKVVVVTLARKGTPSGVYAVRLLANGSRDASFGTDGAFFDDLTSIGLAVSTESTTPAIQSAGKILIGGSAFGASYLTPFLARLTIDGEIDPTLPLRTIVVPSMDEKILAIDADPQGHIVLAGWSGPTQAASNTSVFRTSSQGDLDNVWGRHVGSANDGSSVTSVVTQADNGLLALPRHCITGGCSSTDVMRYKSDGNLDPAFGGATLPQPYTPVIENIGFSTSTGFLVWGEDDGGGTHKRAMIVWRADAAGLIDPQFTTFEAAAGALHDYLITVVEIPAGGGLMGFGYQTNGTALDDHHLVMLKLSATGIPDSTFGTGGLRNDTSIVFQPKAAALRTDHRIAVFGTLNAGTGVAEPVIRSYFW